MIVINEQLYIMNCNNNNNNKDNRVYQQLNNNQKHYSLPQLTICNTENE